MSSTVFTSKNVVARKEYVSNYSYNFDWLITKDENGKLIVDPKEVKNFEQSEIDLIQSCIDDKWRIKNGELHYCQTGVYDGEMYTARCKPGIHDICIKYDLFSED